MRRLLLALAILTMPMAAAAQSGPLPVVTSADRVLGRSDAPATVVEYASFVCSHCARWHTSVYPAFKRRFVDTGQVRLVIRNFLTQPVELSARAAAISRCAVPSRFFDVASAFMTGQTAIIQGAPVSGWFADAIARSGRTPTEIDACLRDPATLAGLRAEVEGAIAAGVPGTPSFFVNGRAVADTSLEGLSAAIRPLLPPS